MSERVQLPKNAPDNSLDHSMIEVEEILQNNNRNFRLGQEEHGVQIPIDHVHQLV